MSEEKKLSREDLLRLELAQERLLRATMQIGMKQLEDKIDELNINKVNLENNVKTLEFQLRRRDRMKEMVSLTRLQTDVGGSLEELKAELAARYDIDWASITYDDVTGQINTLPASNGG